MVKGISMASISTIESSIQTINTFNSIFRSNFLRKTPPQ